MSHLVSLDAPLQPAMLRLRRNLLRLLDVREFADEAQLANPNPHPHPNPNPHPRPHPNPNPHPNPSPSP